MIARRVGLQQVHDRRHHVLSHAAIAADPAHRADRIGMIGNDDTVALGCRPTGLMLKIVRHGDGGRHGSGDGAGRGYGDGGDVGAAAEPAHRGDVAERVATGMPVPGRPCDVVRLHCPDDRLVEWQPGCCLHNTSQRRRFPPVQRTIGDERQPHPYLVVADVRRSSASAFCLRPRWSPFRGRGRPRRTRRTKPKQRARQAARRCA